MTLKDLHKYCIEMAKQYPQHAEEIKDLYILASDEVEDGGSERHECELAISDIEHLVNRK